MPIRLIEIYVPNDFKESVVEVLAKHPTLGVWSEKIAGRQLHVDVLVSAEESEPILDLLEKKLSGVEGFRIIILPVEASIPRPQKPEPEPEGLEKCETKPTRPKSRVSREELYADITEAINLNYPYIALVVLSTIVAAIGLLKDNVAAIIGAMVIAPLLGPNVGLSLATTLGDFKLAKDAFKANVAGLFTALFLSVVIGVILKIDPTIREIATRTQVSLGDIALALASGSAGALAFTTGVSTMLVGVMVAVALLPPLVVLGLLVGSGHFDCAWGALLLLLTNLICVNLSGVITFLAQGVRPLTWWQADRANKATGRAIGIWVVLLVTLVVVIILSYR